MSKAANKTRLWKARLPARLIAGLVLGVLLCTPLLAGTPLPDIPHPKGKGDKCVEDTEVMRKNHMSMLLHQRDETMHKGIRTKKHSLKECISCHVVEESGKPVSIASPKHFCRECHDYAGVNIDCFECHASKPRPARQVKAMSNMPHLVRPMNFSDSAKGDL